MVPLRAQQRLFPMCNVRFPSRPGVLQIRPRTVTYAHGHLESLKADIASLQQEAAEVEGKAREQQEKCAELVEVVRGMDRLALNCLDTGDEERAREIMSEKIDVQSSLERASARVKDLVTLEVKLSESIQLKQAELARQDPDFTAFGDFRDDSAGVRITRDEDGNPTFERTGRAGEAPYSPPPSPSTPAVFQDPWRSPRVPAWQREEDEVAAAMDSGAIPSVDDLLREGDRKIDAQFLELERKVLERSLQASPDGPPGAPEATPAPPPPAPAPPPAPEREPVAEWWTQGQNSLMDGALSSLHSSFDPLYEEAGRALVAVTNARMRGEDPAPAMLLSLVCLALRPPAEVSSALFWGVQTVRGASTLSDNVRLAIYGSALHLVLADLLSGSSEILPEASDERGSQCRALLVALASAVGLKSATASSFSVKMACRASRRSLVSALASLRQASSDSSSTSMDRAEADLMALYELLKVLPMALPLAMGHAAAVEATEGLRRIMSPEDALRLDKLFRLVTGDEGTASAVVRALLGPIIEGRSDKYY